MAAVAAVAVPAAPEGLPDLEGLADRPGLQVRVWERPDPGSQLSEEEPPVRGSLRSAVSVE